jgi:chromosome partitioning protein
VIRLVVANQKGGVGKTTACINLARGFAERGLKVLVIDTDSQGSIAASLGVRTQSMLYHFIIHGHRFSDCIKQVHSRIDVLCSDRTAQDAEAMLMPRTGREMTLKMALAPVEKAYDAILIDVAPSINLFQTCAMAYAQRVLIPLTMDPLSLQGVYAALQAARTLNEMFGMDVRPVGLLPMMVDRRLQITDVILETLKPLSAQYNMPVLHCVRTDAAFTKATRARKFLLDHDRKSKGAEDFNVVTDELLKQFEGELNAVQLPLEAGA